jgi:tetratricopeptide (TPR) repeat protein
MFPLFRRALLLGILAANPLIAQQATPVVPRETPHPGVIPALIKEGTRLHDREDFDGAIGKYREALAIDPENVEALYEMAFSYYAKKDLKSSLENALKAAEKPSSLRVALYVLIGNIYDDQKEPRKALDAYETGLRDNPNVPLLHFNIGVTHRGMGNLAEARASFERALELKPDHPGSHYWLGRTYLDEGYRVPALLALSRFLVLEPTTPRSATAIGWIDGVFHAGVKKGKDGGTQITLDSNTKKDEGDFTATDLMISLAEVSGDVIAKEAGKAERTHDVQRLGDLLTVVGEVGPEGPRTGFAARYYVPFFSGLKGQDMIDAFANYVLQSGPAPASEWLKVNKRSVEKMLAWSRAFRWIAPAPASPRNPRQTPPGPSRD